MIIKHTQAIDALIQELATIEDPTKPYIDRLNTITKAIVELTGELANGAQIPSTLPSVVKAARDLVTTIESGKSKLVLTDDVQMAVDSMTDAINELANFAK